MWKDLVLFLCCVVSYGMNTSYVSQSAVGEHLFPVFIEWDNIPWEDMSTCFSWVPDPSPCFLTLVYKLSKDKVFFSVQLCGLLCSTYLETKSQQS